MAAKSVANNGKSTKRVGGVTGKGFRPGQSGNPTGRPQGLNAYSRKLVGKDGKKLADFWFAVMEDEEAALHLRLEASKLLAERGFGKPTLALEDEVGDGALLLTRLVALASANSN